jgi:3-isopropylmalate/(R)-2-methylmalate dehydratase small subunit
MNELKRITGTAIPLVGDDIDTDRIIPARYLRCITFDGLGQEVFKDDRIEAKGAHSFDSPQFQGAGILLVNGNFGCGSSREHAPQAIAKWGIKAIIGESFAEIFFGNCTVIGLPCVTATSEIVRKIQSAILENPKQEINLDLENLTVNWDNNTESITTNEGSRQSLISGTWDSCGQLLKNQEAIKATAYQLPYLAWV